MGVRCPNKTVSAITTTAVDRANDVESDSFYCMKDAFRLNGSQSEHATEREM